MAETPVNGNGSTLPKLESSVLPAQELPLPPLGSTWRHRRTGNQYIVYDVTNAHADNTNPQKFPIRVSYYRVGVLPNADFPRWSRELWSFLESFELGELSFRTVAAPASPRGGQLGPEPGIAGPEADEPALPPRPANDAPALKFEIGDSVQHNKSLATGVVEDFYPKTSEGPRVLVDWGQGRADMVDPLDLELKSK